MAKRNFLIAFVVLAVVQLAVPLSLAVRHELNLDAGRQYRFRTAAVDPADIFRGRYVTLAVRPTMGRLSDAKECQRGMRLYASLGTDKEGFATISRLTVRRPSAGDYVRVTARNTDCTNLVVVWPFERYYMDEDLAPQAEQVYRRHARRGHEDAVITVRIKDGRATLEDLYVGGEKIHDFLRNAR